jgi:hypothetical protein
VAGEDSKDGQVTQAEHDSMDHGPECTGPFADARECPVHGPAIAARAAEEIVTQQKIARQVMAFMLEYANHAPDCDVRHRKGAACSCGYETQLLALEPVLQLMAQPPSVPARVQSDDPAQGSGSATQSSFSSSSERDRLIAERDRALADEEATNEKAERLEAELFDLRQAHARLLQALTERNEQDDLSRTGETQPMTTDSNPHSPDEKASGWQPIETAPKDLTEVLVYDADRDGVFVAQYESNAQPPYWSYDTHDLVFNARSGELMKPTHWMPLPSPPLPESPR